MIANSTKTCAGCGETKPTSDFYRSASYCADALPRWHAKCKLCCRADTKARKALRTSPQSQFVDRYRARRSAEPAIRAATELLTRPPRITSSINWSRQDLADLKVLAAASVPNTKIAEILGRTVGALYDKARSQNILLAGIIRPKKPKLVKPARAALLLFPYVAAAKPSNTDLLRANAMVPHAWPEWKRADICQAIMLALFEGQITLAELEANRANLGWFTKQYTRSQAPYEEANIGDERGDDQRPYYDRAGGFTLPTQEDAIHEREIAMGSAFATMPGSFNGRTPRSERGD